MEAGRADGGVKRIRLGGHVRLRTLTRWFVKLTVSAAVGVLSVIGLSAAVVADRAQNRIVDDPDLLLSGPSVPGQVAIVPGARVFPNGTPSLTVQDRLDGAVALYRAGAVDHILVSGDNRAVEYNEPVVMRAALIEAGLPAEDLTLDYAGLDTWDTCSRAVDQFGVERAVVVTQHRYAQRTAALCDGAGMDVTVLAVDPPAFQRRSTAVRRSARESLAKVKAVGDLLLDTPPRHGGPVIGLVGSVDMPDGGHPPDWNWAAADADNEPATDGED